MARNIVSQESKRKRSKYTRRACTHCKLAHAKCGHERPCKRCISMDRVSVIAFYILQFGEHQISKFILPFRYLLKVNFHSKLLNDPH